MVDGQLKQHDSTNGTKVILFRTRMMYIFIVCFEKGWQWRVRGHESKRAVWARAMEKTEHTTDEVQRTAKKARNFLSWHMAVEFRVDVAECKNRDECSRALLGAGLIYFINSLTRKRGSVVWEGKGPTVNLKSCSMNVALHQHPGLEYQGVLFILCVGEKENPPE